MKKLSFILFTIFFISCSGNTKKESINTFNKSFIKVFEGKIGDLDFIMKLNSINGKIEGNYFYKSIGDDMFLIGEVDSIGNFNITEKNSKDNKTGTFTGKMDSLKIEGVWKSLLNDKQFNFFAQLSTESYESLKPIIENYSGEYSYDNMYQKDDEYFGSAGDIVLKKISGNEYSFKISVGANPECTGEVEGKIDISDKTAIFKNSGCNLKFIFKSNEIVIEETGDCIEFHGARCSFDGIYKKIIL